MKRKIGRAKAQTRAGRASVSCDQAPVRLHQGALPWAEYRAVGHAIRSFKSVDGAPALTDEYGRGVPVMQVVAVARCSRRLKTQK